MSRGPVSEIEKKASLCVICATPNRLPFYEMICSFKLDSQQKGSKLLHHLNEHHLTFPIYDFKG